MPLYEHRTYTLVVGKMAESIDLYKTMGWPALSKHGGDKLVGYFVGDVGAINQIIHIWRFEDDADRRAFWAAAYADPDFQAFAAKFRPLIITQENKLMVDAPWGPTA